MALLAGLVAMPFSSASAVAGQVDANNVSTAPTINGQLSEAGWNLATTASETTMGAPNNTVTLGAMWDATYLYVGVKVLDANLFNDSGNVWDDDSVEVFIDANHNAGTTYDSFDRQYLKGYNDASLFAVGSGTGVLHASAAITGGYSVELAIPWSNLGVTPTSGLVMGFDVTYDDDDNGGVRDAQAVWWGDVNNWGDTSHFGDVMLMGTGGATATRTPTRTATRTNTPTGPTRTPTRTVTRTNTPTSGGGPSGYTFCANENGTCSFSGTASVAYGANGAFFYRTATNSIACNNATFGDPISGVVKACYYQIGGPTPTRTNTPVGPTATRTNTPVGPTATATSSGSEPPATTFTYPADNTNILNPERGFYHRTSDWLAMGTDMSSHRSQGYTLFSGYVRLDNYRTVALPQSVLDSLNAHFAGARSAGIKIALRFAYNFGPYPNSDPDATEARILSHITQLQPVLQANADVIYVVEAGFIGAWGEWHTSTNGLDTNQTAKNNIMNALLQAVPTSRMVLLRYPADLRAIYGSTSVSSSEAFSGSNKARSGHHNDCFLASADDQGTYERDGSTIAQDKALIAGDGRFVPVGGETCGSNPPRSDCPTATAELAQMHWSYLNDDFETTVLNSWKTQGCYPDVQKKLGYRLALTQAAFNTQVKPGGILRLTANLQNTGYSSLYNPRPLVVVLDQGTTRYEATLSAVDVRRWESGSAPSFAVNLRVPANAPAGTYRLSFWLPDGSSSLRNNPLYAVRLANTTTWNAAGGLNILSTSVAVNPSAPGASDPNATQFVVIP